MDIDVREASFEEKPVLWRLLQLYSYDLGLDADDEGRFEYRYFDNYWTESGRFPFLVQADGRLAGFALVSTHAVASKAPRAKTISEFFVMRNFRRRGVGRAAALRLFDLFPGKWEVRQTNDNVAAQRFWRTVISDYTSGRFEEVTMNSSVWRGPVQIFDNGHGP